MPPHINLEQDFHLIGEAPRPVEIHPAYLTGRNLLIRLLMANDAIRAQFLRCLNELRRTIFLVYQDVAIANMKSLELFHAFLSEDTELGFACKAVQILYERPILAMAAKFLCLMPLYIETTIYENELRYVVGPIDELVPIPLDQHGNPVQIIGPR